MADYSVNVDLPDHKRGDRWLGIAQIGPVIIDELAPDAALERVRMQLRLVKGRNTVGTYTIDSEPGTGVDAPAVIEDAAEWIASIPPIQDFVPLAGKWSWDIEFYDAANAEPLTLYKGVLTVHDDVTRPPTT